MVELRPAANSKYIRLLVRVNIQDCKKDVRISITARAAMTKRTPPYHSQVLSRLGLIKENSRDVSEGASVISEGMDLPFIGQQWNDTIIVEKNYGRLSRASE